MIVPLADIVYAVVLFSIILVIRFLSTPAEERSIIKILLQSIVILVVFLLIPPIYGFIQNKAGQTGSTVALLVFAGVFAWYCYRQYQVLLKGQKKLDRKYKGVIREMKHDFK